MRLSLDQIKSITAGALDVWVEDGIFRFSRFTSKQVEGLYNLEAVFKERAEYTSGVRLDFYTNSKIFAFTAKTSSQYEIYIDNVLTHVYFKEDFEDKVDVKIELDGKEHRITLYLPSHTMGTLQSVEIEDGASLVPHKFDCKILFIGDSITQGWVSKWDSLSYTNNVSRFFNAQSINQGIGGSYFHETIFDEDIQYEPDIILVAYGTNDWGHGHKSIESGREHCKKHLDMLVSRYGNKKIFGITPIWRGDADRMTEMGDFDSCVSYVKEEIINHGMILIEGSSIMPPIPDFYADKFLHPDSNGFCLYALNLIAQMQKYL